MDKNKITRDRIIGLVIDEYLRLKSLNEDHDLLRYVSEINNNGFNLVKSKIEEFVDRFSDGSYEKEAYPNKQVFKNYYIMLKRISDIIDNYKNKK